VPAWKKTQKGRVVHDRKIHPFTIRDLIRIGLQTASLILYASPGAYSNLSQELSDDSAEDPDFSFGGGSLGGGGATGSFGGDPLKRSPRVIMIVERLET